MQPNTSLRLRMCISPLMFRSDIIPFSPYRSPLQTQFTFPTAPQSPRSSSRMETSPARRRRTPRPPPSIRQRIFQLSPSVPRHGTPHIAICDVPCGYYEVHSPTCIEPFSPCTCPSANLPPYPVQKQVRALFARCLLPRLCQVSMVR